MPDFINDLKSHFEDKLGFNDIQYVQTLNEYSLIVPVDRLIEVMGSLKHSIKFLQLTDITAVDYPKKSNRFEIVYHLLNMHRNMRVRVKTAVAETANVPTIIKIYPAANWYEREVFDMFGITFDNHPNLGRILTDYTFEAYPMRKDFPTEGRFEVHYDETKRCVVYDPISLPQARRHFDFMQSRWFDPTYESSTEGDSNA